MDELGARRTRRWWQTGRPIRSIGWAGAFVEDVGFALLFPTAGMALPSLYETACEQPVPLAETGWGRTSSGGGAGRTRCPARATRRRGGWCVLGHDSLPEHQIGVGPPIGVRADPPGLAG